MSSILTYKKKKNAQIYQPYSKSKLELESNLSEILSVNCKFVCWSTPT